MTSKARLSIDLSPALRDELKIFASLKKVPVQRLVLTEIMTLLRQEAMDASTPYSAVANRTLLQVSPHNASSD